MRGCVINHFVIVVLFNAYKNGTDYRIAPADVS